jgi:hypothetical protein
VTRINCSPLTIDRWHDLETVMGGGRGVYGHCWCMYWRLPRKQFEASLGDENRRLFRARVLLAGGLVAGTPPDRLALMKEVVGWLDRFPGASEDSVEHPFGWVPGTPR